MKRIGKILLVLMFTFGCLGVANAQTITALNVPGSLLVFPLVDNNTAGTITILDIVNRGDTDVWLKGFIVGHTGPNDDDPTKFHKKDFVILLTQKQPIIWNTSQALDDGTNFVQSFDGLKGYMVIWAIDNDKDQNEIAWDELKGDGVVVNVQVPSAFRYNAIPHQAVAITPDYVLNLDGNEYTAASERILCEGFTDRFARGMTGTLAVANVGVNFITSDQPEFDINIGVWNVDEQYQSRHVDFDQYEQYTLEELQIQGDEINSPKFQFATSATDSGGVTQALWAVFYQTIGGVAFGGQCFMDPAGLAPAVITLSVPTQ
jgi:hypothetical protein